MRSKRRPFFGRPANTVVAVVWLSSLLVIAAVGCNREKEDEGKGAGGEAVEKAEEAKSKGPAQVTLTAEAVEKYGVRVDVAKTQVLTPTFVAPGEVAFDTERLSHVGAPVAGRVRELKIRIGESVRKGDVLIVVDSPELGAAQSEYLQRRTAVTVAGPAVALAKNGYDRAKKLFDEQQGIALTEVQRREGEHRTAEGNLQTAESAATAALNRLQLLGMDAAAVKKLEVSSQIDPTLAIRAPIDGQVVERAVTHGELVRPEKESLITIVDLGMVWVLADVPEFRLRGLDKGSKALIKTGDGTPTLRGTVTYLPPLLDPSTRTAQVRVEVKNEGGVLRAGTFTQVEIEAGKPKADTDAVVAVPEEAVQTIDGGPCLFVPGKEGDLTFAQRPITVGPSVGGLVPVLSGLKAGQRYVNAGTFVLKAELGKSSIEE